MGIHSLLSITGLVGLKDLPPADLRDIVQGKTVAVEANAYLVRATRAFCGHEPRATQVYNNIATGSDIDPHVVTTIATTAVKDILAWLLVAPSRIIVVLEGYFSPKEQLYERHAVERKAAFESMKWQSSVTVADIITEAFIRQLTAHAQCISGMIVVVQPPGEADGQLAFLSATGGADVIAVPSGDSDLLIYPGVKRIVFYPAMLHRGKLRSDHGRNRCGSK